MRRLGRGGFAAILVLLASVPPGIAALQTGEVSPQTNLADLDGRTVGLPGEPGKVVSVTFFALWCEPCLQSLPEIERAAARYGGRGYVARLVAVSHRQDAARLRDFANKRGLEMGILLDDEGRAERLFGVPGLPYTVLIGRDGIVREAGYGLTSSLGEAVSRLVSEKTP